jgi:hypothetical protein
VLAVRQVVIPLLVAVLVVQAELLVAESMLTAVLVVLMVAAVALAVEAVMYAVVEAALVQSESFGQVVHVHSLQLVQEIYD